MPPSADAPIRTHIFALLSTRDPPKTICPSEAARRLTPAELDALGASDWRAAMGAVRAVAWEMRENGEVEICQGGKVLGREVGLGDVRGPVRVRRVDGEEGAEG